MSEETAIFYYNPDLVCATCRTNEFLHYNLVVFARNGKLIDDPDCAHYCDGCMGLDPALINPKEEP